MIKNEELKKYDIHTAENRNKFLILGNYFLRAADKAIVSGDTCGIDYIAFHLFNDETTKHTFLDFIKFLSDFCGSLKRKDYPDLVDNLCNFIIILLEPEAKKNNQEYNAELNLVWREITENDDVLKNNSHFSKYLR